MNERWQSMRRNWRFTASLVVLALVALLNVTVAQWRPPFEIGYTANTTAEIAEREAWIKGAPVFLANHFDRVAVTNVAEGVEASFVFERTLAEIYGVDANYAEPPVELGPVAQRVANGIAPHVKHESEIFCNYQDAKYCDLQIAWVESDWYPSPLLFVGVVLGDGHFALVESQLLADLTGGQN